MSDATIIREAVQPLTGSAQDYDSLLALIGEARFVLLGKASHGTHEFYAERAAITKRLIAEPEIQQGIAYAAAEAIIKFVQGHSGTGRSGSVLRKEMGQSYNLHLTFGRTSKRSDSDGKKTETGVCGSDLPRAEPGQLPKGSF
jgi:hypothetical protein